MGPGLLDLFYPTDKVCLLWIPTRLGGPIAGLKAKKQLPSSQSLFRNWLFLFSRSREG